MFGGLKNGRFANEMEGDVRSDKQFLRTIDLGVCVLHGRFLVWPHTIQLHGIFVANVNMNQPKFRLVQPLWKAVWRFLKKLKVELPYGPAVALLGIYPKAVRVLI